jgi:hypothetical protein
LSPALVYGGPDKNLLFSISTLVAGVGFEPTTFRVW